MNSSSTHQSVLGSLRSVTPLRDLDFDEALRIAELQASKLAALFALDDGVREHHIAGLPRIVVIREPLAVSGMSHWNGTAWIITLASHDSLARQRFTLLHEFKHIIDHGQTAHLYRGDKRRSASEQAEAAADYFAGCALIPKRQLKSAWGRRIQQVTALADLFGVSEPAIRVRLAQTGLNAEYDEVPPARCARPVSTAHNKTQRFRVARPSYARRYA